MIYVWYNYITKAKGNDIMTQKEAYALGYVYGLVESKMPDYDRTGFKYGAAAARPFSGMGQLFAEAHRRGVITKDMDASITEALNDVSSLPNDGQEDYQPMPIQGAWQLGCYAGKAGKPYFDIAKKREQIGMSQEELARQLGVPQSSVSRWESGKVRPKADTLEKIRGILADA